MYVCARMRVFVVCVCVCALARLRTHRTRSRINLHTIHSTAAAKMSSMLDEPFYTQNQSQRGCREFRIHENMMEFDNKIRV